MSVREATRAAQDILKGEVPNLVVDGWWGSTTNKAYLRASAGTQRRVDAALARFGLTRTDVYVVMNDVTSQALSLGQEWIDSEKVLSLIERAAGITGVSAAVLRDFLNLEAAKRSEGGRLYYNARSVAPNGLYHGLFQMGRPAWTDANKQGPTALGDFVANRYDPWINTIAGAQYALFNQRVARGKGYKGPFTAEVLYAMHNQGVGGFLRLMRERTSNRALDVQSRKAKQVIAQALSQNGVALA